jgi:hypothetical protein
MNRIESIHVAPTSEQRAQPGRFQTVLRSAAAGVVGGVAAGVELAAPFVPGGTVISAAVRAGASGLARTALGGGGGEADVLAATRVLQQESQAFNAQYLQLQEGMQRESREFTAISNVMKVRHDSAKAAIQNIH